MSFSIFGEKSIQPTEELLDEALANSKPLWELIKNHVITTYENSNVEWKFYSKAAGWTFVLKSGKRTLLYLIPLHHYFKVNFVFGEKAVALAQNSELSESIISLILEAKPYMEGRSFMVDVKTDNDIADVMKLLEIKS